MCQQPGMGIRGMGSKPATNVLKTYKSWAET